MTYGQFNVLEMDDKLSIIKQIPRRNMCWEIYIPDAGEDAYKICQLLNKEWEDRQPKTFSAEAEPPNEPSPGDIYDRMSRGETISFDERQRAPFYIPPDGTTDPNLLDKIGWDVTTTALPPINHN